MLKKNPIKKIPLRLSLVCGGLGIVFICLSVALILINHNISTTSALLADTIEENQKRQQQWDVLSQSLLLLTRDTNEIRSYLGFGENTYPVFSKNETEETQAGNGNGESDESLILFLRGLEKIHLQNHYEAHLQLFRNFWQMPEFQALLQEYKLTRHEDNPLSSTISSAENLYFTIVLDEQQSKIIITDFLGKSYSSISCDQSTLTFLKTGILKLNDHYRLYSQQAELLAKKIQSTEIRQYLQEQKLSLSNRFEDFTQIKYTLSFNEKSVLNIGITKLNMEYFINNQKIENVEKLPAIITAMISGLDLKSERQEKITNTRQRLLAAFQEPAFISLLDSKNLKIMQTPRKQPYFDYYDVMDLQDNRIGSFAVQNFTGDLYITDKDEIQIAAINALNDLEKYSDKKKINIPQYLPEITDLFDNKDGLTFLVCGSNENNTDTIIIVNIDQNKRTMTMFAIPRDLYYQGRRINTGYFRLGAESFLKELSRITGLNIKKYIHINMFAFIEVINILGGVKIVLEEDLIDPTYKIKENGQWSTLYYPKGEYQLNGIQALRVARSRNFSSDFERSKRQQQILVAVGNKFKELGIGNLDKISGLVTTLLKYVKTNFSLIEMVQFFNKFRDYTIDAQHTLDTDNVLDATYSNIYLLQQTEQKAVLDENFDKGMWILIPKENDWNVIKWYIRELINPA